jgi:hypothetical protein
LPSIPVVRTWELTPANDRGGTSGAIVRVSAATPDAVRADGRIVSILRTTWVALPQEASDPMPPSPPRFVPLTTTLGPVL